MKTIKIDQTNRKWWHKIFGINKPKVLSGLTLKDFNLKESDIYSFEEIKSGVYKIVLKANV